MTGIARETLVLRRGGFSPPLSLLMPTFAFPEAPAPLAGRIRRRRNAPLPIPRRYMRRTIPRLRCLPYTRLLSTPGPSTSELLRTL